MGSTPSLCLCCEGFEDWVGGRTGADLFWGYIVATGSSVTKTASGGEEIVVQGDNSDDIFDWVVDVGKVPEDNVECIEDKKKKSAG